MKAHFISFVSFLKNKKRYLISFSIHFVLFFISFVSCSLFSLGTSNAFCESVAKKMGDKVYECEVVSSKPNDNLRYVFNYADDLAGREIKESIDTYVVSYTRNEQFPAIVSVNETKIYVDSILEYTTWQFEKYNYGFKTLSGAPIRNIDPDEAYINIYTASLIADVLGCKEKDLIGSTVEINTNLSKRIDLFIVDIVINMDDINLGPYFQSKACLITNYSDTASHYTNLKYVTVLRSGYLAKNYAIRQIENTIKLLNKESVYYSSTYRKLVNNELLDDGIQKLIDTTRSFFNTNNSVMISFAIIPLATIVCISIMIHLAKTKVELLISLFASATLFAIFVHLICSNLVVNNTVILLTHSPSSFIVILYLIIIICAYFIFTPGDIAEMYKRKGKRKIVI